MRLLRRDPNLGYVDSLLWVPKAHINVEGTKAALTFPVNDKRKVRFLTLYQETPDHLIVPREFWDPKDLPFPVLDGRPRSFPEADIRSSIVLDAQTPSETTQRDAVRAMRESRGGILQLACGKGKAQPVTTPVLTPRGWVPLGSLQVGDQVIGSNGKPTEVLGVYPQGTLPVFEVTMEDGTSTKCCAQHLWFTQTPSDRRKESEGEVRTLTQIRETLRTRAGAQHAIPRTAAVEFEHAPPVYSPWLLGAYLGDGNSGIYAGQKRLQLHKESEAFHRKVWKHLDEEGSRYSVVKDPRSKNSTTNVLFQDSRPALWDALEKYGLIGVGSKEKFIPKEYLHASVEERWALLNGLLDSDGSVLRTARSFSTSSPQLFEGFVELARSLGIRVTCERRQTYFTHNGKRRPGAPSWRAYLSHDIWGKGRYNRKQYIQSVLPAGEAECVCIRVAAEDHLYVTENYIVTHNTVCALELAAQERVPTIIIVDNTHLLGQWKGEIEKFLTIPGGMGIIGDGQFDWKKPLVISTYQTLAQRAAEFPQEARHWFGLAIWDEAHHMAAPTWARTADLFYGKRIGLTATPERVDGTHVIYDFHIGKVLYKDLTQELKPSIYFYWTGLEVDPQDPLVREKVCDVNGELHTSMLSSYFGEWQQRLDLIIEEVKKAERQQRKVLVLSYSIAELVNMFCMWSGAKSLYTQIPYPTEKDVGEKVPPAQVDPKSLRRLFARKKEIEALLAKATPQQVHPLKLQHAEVCNRIKAHDVWEKCELEYARRQRAFLKKALEDNKSNAGLMIGSIKVEERMKMLRNKQIVFAIMKYGREGLDEKSIDTVFVCEPMSQKNSLQQLMGRALRKKPGKKTPVIVFFEDNIGPMMGMCQNLRGHLRSWPIEEGGPFHYDLVGHPRKGTRTTWVTL